MLILYSGTEKKSTVILQDKFRPESQFFVKSADRKSKILIMLGFFKADAFPADYIKFSLKKNLTASEKSSPQTAL